ncbi:MAG: hypothetical protein OJI67_13915 [Prosthecobacter sp.]|nr:hypothetical protein [Prosthecobacter sp.]
MDLTSIDLTPLLSLKDYWYATASAVLGSLIALWLTARQRNSARKDAEKHARKALLRSIQFNQERLFQIVSQLTSSSTVPNYSLDTIGMTLWLQQSHGILNDDVRQAVDAYRYQLDHIAVKLNQHLLIVTIYNGTFDEGLPRTATEAEVRQSIVMHAQQQIEAASKLIRLMTE